MKILAVDTATKTCSVAVTENDSLLAEITVNHAKTHTAFLMKLIHAVLKEVFLSLDDMDGFAITIGPGSFTGLRIGLSSIKGFSAATGKPVVGVSTLEALARIIPYTSNCICPMIDARKGQVYFARYRYHNGVLINESPVCSLHLMHAIENKTERCIFIGDGALTYKKLIMNQLGNLALFAHSHQHVIKASVVAQLSLPKFLNGKTDAVDSLVPAYARKSDVETGVEAR